MKKTIPNRLTFLGLILLLALTFQACKKELKPIYPNKTVQLDPERAATLADKIRQEVAVEIDEDFELSLWASDSLAIDPVAISIDDQGRVFYTRGSRIANSEFDIRSHRDWMTASISFQSVEDRRAFIRKTFSETNEVGERFLKDLNEDGELDWRDLTVEKEQVWFVEDANSDGTADRAQLYLEDFNDEITDLANGIEYHDGAVYISVGPDFWRTEDRDGDGIADKKESLSHGYMVHIGFGAHGMSGAKMGPDGRIWWGIGDIGMNVVDKDGKNWKYPNQGVIARSETDGSGFEVYSAGLRNTHEFVFDQYGNLITEDNDGDHQGERERLVYLINGSDGGWRINWQFGKYTDPDNNTYKVWMDEKLGVPRWEGQAAYILPPIVNYVNGPTGMVYNPGTALGEKWYNHFFIAEFRGTAANSPVHAFTLKPKGATFELDQTKEVVKGVLPTGIDFGPDGALYIADWIEGWNTNNEGRIWKLDVPGEANSAIRQETKKLIQADFGKNTEEELREWLQHQDMRVRQKAQFELVKRGQKGFENLLAAAKQTSHQLARIHGLWGIAQVARKGKMEEATNFLPFLNDADPEIVAQAAKMLGDIKYAEAGDNIIPLLEHKSLRVQLLATEALGRIAHKPAVQPILDMLLANNDEDAWLRHAGMIALGRIGEEAPLVALHNHDSIALRIAAVVALRRMKSPGVAQFLQDQDEYVVTEAARAINDDFSIEAALPDLAKVLAETRFSNEALLRRAINANVRVGQPENLNLLVAYVNEKTAPSAMRAEALEALGTWAKPSVLDRVDGRYRGVIERDGAPVKQALEPILNNLLKENQPAMQIAAAKATGKLSIDNTAPTLMALVKNNKDAGVRAEALKAMHQINAKSLDEALEIAFADKDPAVRSTALEIVPESDIPEDKAVELFKQILKNGTDLEQQATLNALASLEGGAGVKVLDEALDNLIAGKQSTATQLDVIEAVEKQNDPALMEKLKAYQAAKPKDDPLALYRETLAGGNARRGWQLFHNHEAAQCIRCHSIFELGGNAGPGLAGVADRLSKEELLSALITPSAELAMGYGVVILEMKDGATVSGIVMEETPEQLRLKIGKEDIQEVDKLQIEKRENIPSSMPAVGDILTKKEIRDLIEMLSNLREDI